MAVEKNRLKMLNKLADSGIDTEKKISSLDLPRIISIPGITVPEIQMITELKEAIKSRSVISYLCAGKDEEKAVTTATETEENNYDRGEY